jgi:hypothetical protein
MTSVADIVLQVRKKCDMENTDFVTDEEIMGYLNEAQNTLFDEIVVADEAFFATDVAVTITSLTASLPADCYKLVGVDMLGGPRPRTLRRTSFAQRNEAMLGAVSSNPKYYLKGNTIHFVPAPVYSTLKLHYIPNITEFTDLTDLVVEPINHWRKYIVCSAAVDCLAKEESSVTVMLKLRDDAMEAAKQCVRNRDYSEAQSITDVHSINSLNEWDNWDV